jgi:hypothetical protein
LSNVIMSYVPLFFSESYGGISERANHLSSVPFHPIVSVWNILNISSNVTWGEQSHEYDFGSSIQQFHDLNSTDR